MREVSSKFLHKVRSLFVKEVRHICDLCKEEDDPKCLFGIKYVWEGDVRRIDFTKALDVADTHICTSCICSITHANNKGAFRDY